MTITELTQVIKAKQNYLCIGLDTDITKIPKNLLSLPNPVLAFNKAIIDATKDYCVAYKLNTAFYEALGAAGWQCLADTVAYIPSTHFTIADAKRGDIGNTSAQYAKAFFEVMNFDAITVSPYMGADSIKPYLAYKNKTTIVLALTSNDSAADFELQKTGDQYLYEKVIIGVSAYGSASQVMFVVGATKAEALINVRKLIPQHFLLIPGVGFQGGSLSEVTKHGYTNNVGLLVTVSRAIIYASDAENYAIEAAEITKQYHYEMQNLLTQQLG